MCRLVVAALIAALGSGAPVLAQVPLHEAISPSLSQQDVAAAFEAAVVDICAPAVIAGQRLSAAAPGIRARIAAASDADAARQVGAEAGDSVWEVAAARGVVRIRERNGRCMVSAYGPPAATTLGQVARRLAASGQGFERLVATPGPGAAESLVRRAGDSRVQATLGGSEPGMQGNRSRFSVLTATVFAGPG
jgi:hypothetical protein